MDYVGVWQPESAGDHALSGTNRCKWRAFLCKSRPCGAMYRAGDTAAHLQFCICGVDDRINIVLSGNVADGQLQGHISEPMLNHARTMAPIRLGPVQERNTGATTHTLRSLFRRPIESRGQPATFGR
jgi:hypothetical protein